MKNFKEWLKKENFEEPKNPQEKEEFLRDVIAVIQGQPSPEFYPDQSAVMKKVEKILSMIDSNNPKAKRILLQQLEKQWQNAKDLADAWLKRKIV